MKRIATALILLAAAGLTAPTFAEQHMQKSEDRDKSTRAVIGKVVDARDVTLKGDAGDKHRLIRLENKDGKRIVANLGAMEGAKDVDIQKGDMLLVIGRSARINNKPVLFAKYFGEIYRAGRQSASMGKKSQ